MTGKAQKVWWTVRHGSHPFKLLANRCAPAIEHEPLFRSLDLDCVIDVGANVGQFAAMVRAIKPDAKLLMFEPLPDALKRLRRVFASDSLSTIYPCAISAAAGDLVMHVSGRADSSSLLSIGPVQSQEYRGTQEVRRIVVPVRRLDDILRPADLGAKNLLKIDVQGAELRVLEGAIHLLKSLRWIYCEVSFVELYSDQALAHDVLRYLDGNGFRLETVATLSRGSSGRVLQADFLFRSKAG